MSSIKSTKNKNIFHEKNRFTLLGFSMFENLINELKFDGNDKEYNKIKHLSYTFHPSELRNSEKWSFPLLIDIKHKIQESYGMNIKEIEVNLFTDCDIHAYNETDYNTVFIVSIGDTRTFIVDDSEYELGDGDMLFVRDTSTNICNFMNSFIDYSKKESKDKLQKSFHIFFYA